METYKNKLNERVSVIYTPAMTETVKPVTRQDLINKGWIEDLPKVNKFHNRYRKDILLTQEQKDSLKENYGVQFVKGVKMTEKEVLNVLRKRHKHHKFTPFIIISN